LRAISRARPTPPRAAERPSEPLPDPSKSGPDRA
jgi:hypothetical protein